MRMLARKNILDLEPYEPGKPIKELERELGIRAANIIKLASNENPIGPSPKAVKAILKGVRGINRYPDGNAFYLKKRLASKLGVKPQNLVLGNGSDELIDIVTKAFLEEDEEAIVSAPAFLEYRIIVKTKGATVRTVPLLGPSSFKRNGLSKKFAYNIDNILKAINKKTKLIFIGNPDNPTGVYFTKSDLNYFLERCPDNIIAVFDEAYRELVDIKDYSNPQLFIGDHNIIILRTFSKAYGLAGLRVGYAVTNEQLACWMERVRLPFNINMLAQLAAEAALEDSAHLNKTKMLISDGRRFLGSEFMRLGFDVIVSPANFILFSYKGKISGTDFFKKLLPYGVIVRDMKAYGLAKWARVNVGTMPENRRFIETLKKVI